MINESGPSIESEDECLSPQGEAEVEEVWEKLLLKQKMADVKDATLKATEVLPRKLDERLTVVDL